MMGGGGNCYNAHLIKWAHGGGGGGYDVVDEEEERVLRPQADPLPDEEVELSHRQVYRDEEATLLRFNLK